MLKVYVEHDGTPWIGGEAVAADPTPRVPLALELMARDTGPRLFLGRPCYYRFTTQTGCTPYLWTHGRYSSEVVDSMVAAVRSYGASRSFGSVVLIGYSGGGTIAWLMAQRMPEVDGVLTVAANLDVELWTGAHSYAPMRGSLNPASEPPLPSSVVQVHFQGGRDGNVMPEIGRSFAQHHPDAYVVEIPEFDHVCCWVERWPDLLTSFAERKRSMARPMPG